MVSTPTKLTEEARKGTARQARKRVVVATREHVTFRGGDSHNHSESKCKRKSTKKTLFRLRMLQCFCVKTRYVYPLGVVTPSSARLQFSENVQAVFHGWRLVASAARFSQELRVLLLLLRS